MDVRRATRLIATTAVWVATAAWFWVVIVDSVLAGYWGIDGRTYFDVWDTSPMYQLAPRTHGAYLYSPAFAHVIAPLTSLPWAWFAALWAVMSSAAYLWMVKPLGIWWAIPMLSFAVEDLRIGQTTWLLALVCVLGLRYPSMWAAAVLTKVVPGVGVLWFVFRGEWREVRIAVFGTGAIVAASALAAPSLWVEWMRFLVASSDGVGSLMYRLPVAVGLLYWAATRNYRWALPVVVMLALPVGGLYSLGLLCAIPRLVVRTRDEERNRDLTVAPLLRTTPR